MTAPHDWIREGQDRCSPNNLLAPCGHADSQATSQLHGVCIFCWRDRAAVLRVTAERALAVCRAAAEWLEKAKHEKGPEAALCQLMLQDILRGEGPGHKRTAREMAADLGFAKHGDGQDVIDQMTGKRLSDESPTAPAPATETELRCDECGTTPPGPEYLPRDKCFRSTTHARCPGHYHETPKG